MENKLTFMIEKHISETGIEYYNELPVEYIKMPEFKELFKLGEGETVLTLESAQIRTDLILIVYNPITNKYYPRYISNSSDKKKLLRYFQDGNLYIKENDLIWKK